MKLAAIVGGAAVLPGVELFAAPYNLPLGLQLYSLRKQLPTDYEGTLRQIAALGYKEVEAAGFYGHDAAQVNAAMKDAGLRCVSAHYAYDALHPKLDELIEFSGKIGLEYIICSWPGKAPLPAKERSTDPSGFTLNDWRWNADQFNQIGERVNKAGMRFGYHNHKMEFAPQDGVVPYDELLRLTDPAKVTMELDCGWVIVGGGDPAAYLRKYADRISMLHVKDFKTLPAVGTEPAAAELGQGKIDYRPIFAAANKAALKHCFVEQEEFDMAPMESLKVDAAYLRNLKV